MEDDGDKCSGGIAQKAFGVIKIVGACRIFIN